MPEKKKILVVDDDPIFIDIMQLRLEANNYQVITANSGRDCLERLEEDKPDAIFLDIMMPKMNGIATLSHIRKKNKDIPVFMLTASSAETHFVKANKLKAAGFIIKTGDLQKEVKNVTNFLEISERYKSDKDKK